MRKILTVNDLIEEGKKNSNKISQELLNDFLDSSEFAEAEIEKLYESLKAAKVEIEPEEESEADDKLTVDQIEKSLESEGVAIDDPVKVYLKEIGNIPLLSAEEEVEIAKKIEAGRMAEESMKESADMLDDALSAEFNRMIKAGERAKKKLVEHNLRLVISIAKKYVNRGLPLLDLIQEGNIGLMKARDKFDHTKGFKFSTYATWWIRQAISRAIADQSRTIRVPVHMVDTINRVKKARGQLMIMNDREPTPEEIAEYLGMPLGKVVDALKNGRDVLSLDSPVGDEEDATLGSFISDTKNLTPEDSVTNSQLKERIAELLEGLTEREAFVLKLRFGLEDGDAKTLEDVGTVLGVTRERVRQIEAKALKKIKHPTRIKKLEDFYRG